MRVSTFIASTALALTLSALPEPVWAQDAPEAGDGDGIIIVTAQKREQLLVDVPLSITVVSGETLERQQAVNFQDYLKLVPGLQLNQTTPGFGRLVLRGLNTGGVASTVAVYMDETVFGSSTSGTNGSILAGDFDTFDIARIEVLRGPQGTLYGANALGGVLKYVTNDPSTKALEGRVRGGVETTSGGDASYYGSALVNLPVGDALAVRASGFYRDIGGFIDSIGTGGSDVEDNIDSSKSYGGRAAVLFEPSDALSIELTGFLQNLRNNASSSVDSDATTGASLYGRLSQSQFVPERSEIDYRVYSGLINADLGFAELVSATSYSTVEQRFQSDLTPQYSGLVQAVFGVPNDFLLGQVTRVRRFTQELRLQSPSNTIFEWTIGGYYNREIGLIDQAFDAVEPGTLTAITGLPLLGVATSNGRYRELAGFANATLYLGDRFDIGFGGRYSHNKQSARQESDGVLAGGAQVIDNIRSTENVFTFSVAPKFKLNERASIYARVAKGYRPGGPNVIPPGVPADTPQTFDSDSVLSYEAGIKAETGDRTFAIDFAAFYIDWKDIQLYALVNGFGVNVNGGRARSQGLEFTAVARPVTGLSFALNGAYTDAKLRDDTPSVSGGLRGDRLPYTPEYSIGLNADYEWALAEDKTAFAGASLRSLSRQTATYDLTFRTANGRQRTLPAYEVVDLRAGVDFGKFTLEAYAKNITNAEGKTAFEAPGNVPLGAGSTAVIRPRVIGLALTAGF